MPAGQSFRPKKENPVERIILGLPDMAITKVLSISPCVLEVRWTGEDRCPHCGGTELRTKDSFWREIKSYRIAVNPVTLKIRCHKFRCEHCGRYFNTRLPGIKMWNRSTELLKKNVFLEYNKGISNKDIAELQGISVATAERFYHQMILHENSQFQNRPCPRFLGIDEHRFTRRKGFATTFCDLGKNKVFDLSLGKSASALDTFLCSLKGCDRVRVVCIDMNSAYRNIVRQYFPKAMIVSDRFHVIRLINQHVTTLCKLLDEEYFAGRNLRMLRLLLMRRENLSDFQEEKLQEVFSRNPALQAVYEFSQELCELLRIRRQNKEQCRKLAARLLACINELCQSPFKAMSSLGRTLATWKEEIARMFRFSKNNGITEGFHRKMKLIQRRAYGFRNFENYRLRVRVLCG